MTEPGDYDPTTCDHGATRTDGDGLEYCVYCGACVNDDEESDFDPGNLHHGHD